jgi:glycosyltransferase involved in cell wall biosynthesis
MRVAIVIPAYNEAATIREVAAAAAQFAPVYVVDDGSRDDTAARLQDAPVTLLRHEVNRGKAASLWHGAMQALAAGAEAVITLDGDGQHRPAEIPQLVEQAEANPGHIVIAARLRNRDATPPLRLFGNRFANFWISWAAGCRIADSQSGFRLYPAELLRQIELNLDAEHSFVFESEVLIAAADAGFRCTHVEIEALYPAGNRKSHYRPARDTYYIVRMVARRLALRGFYPTGLLRSLGLLPG